MDFSRPCMDSPVLKQLFEIDLVFKDFSRKPSLFSTFQACVNSVIAMCKVSIFKLVSVAE